MIISEGRIVMRLTKVVLFCLFATLPIIGGQGCTDTDGIFDDCTSDEQCPEGRICLNKLCLEPQCDTDEITCDRQCVNPRIELEFCGGCDGCPELPSTEPLQCLEGQCVYRCQEGFVDTDGDIDRINGNGCECQTDGPEICDGKDNDRDGLTDAEDDDVVPCNTEPGAAAQCIAGSCALACEVGAVDLNSDLGNGGDGCECQISDEVCDGEDNDCDGATDGDDEALSLAECPVVEGAEAVDCAGAACIYACQEDTLDVNGDLEEGIGGDGCECTPGGVDVCDGVDNDCDGDVDDEDDDFEPPACALSVGACEGAQALCEGGQAVECPESVYREVAEVNGLRFQTEETLCDEVDNDCDGDSDELCCQEVSAFEVAGGDEFFNALDAVSNEAGTQVAVLTTNNLDGDFEVLLLDENGGLTATISNLGSSVTSGRASLHRNPTDEKYVFVRFNDDRIFITDIFENGTASAALIVTLGQSVRPIKTVDVGSGAFWVAGITNGRTLRIFSIRGGSVEATDSVSPDDLGFFFTIDDVSFQDGDVFVRGELAATNDGSSLERSLYVIQVDLAGTFPSVSRDNMRLFDKTSLDTIGRNSGGSKLIGDNLYRVIQEVDVNVLVRQSLSRGQGGPQERLTSATSLEMDLRNVHHFDLQAILVVDIGDTAGPPFLNRLDEMGSENVLLLNVDSFEFGRKISAPHRHGVFIGTVGIDNTSARLFSSILNIEGQPLCPQ